MTKRRDELDPRAARRFAWGVVPADALTEGPCEPPGAVDESPEGGATDPNGADAAPEPDAEAGDAAPGKAVDMFAAARAAGLILAAGVRRVWELDGGPSQARALAEILGNVDAHARFYALGDHPVEAVQLARLLIRHRARLDAATVEAAETVTMGIDLSGPDAAELALEVARAGDWQLQFRFVLAAGLGADASLPESPRFGERLGQIIDAGPTWDARDLAAVFAGMIHDRGVVPALRRALGSPCLVVRWRALDALERRFRDELRAEDVLPLLCDAVERPLEERGRDEDDRRSYCYFPELLEKVTARLAPAGGAELLTRIARFQCPYRHEHSALGRWWALAALAACYPRDALAVVDEHLTSHFASYRAFAVDAAAKLPEADARLRLLRAAADGAPDVSIRAADAWRKRFGQPCPVGELDGLELGLLDSPPSDKLRGRALVLRGPLEARRKLASVLLAEAPDPEALVLLIAAMADDDLAEYTETPELGLPSRSEWCPLIAERFGARGVRGLCALAERYSGDPQFGWLRDLGELLEKKGELVGDAERVLLRAIAERRFRRVAEPEYPTLHVLRYVGYTPDLEPRLWSIALGGLGRSFDYCAAMALVAQGGPAVDERAVAELGAALAERDFARFTRAATVGLGRRLPAARALVLEALEAASEVESLDDKACLGLTHAVQALAEAGALPTGWVETRLVRPETAGFSIAAQVAGWTHPPRKADVRLLRAALASPARAGSAAAEAAAALLHYGTLSLRSPKLAPIVVAAPPRVRAELLWSMVMARVPLSNAVWTALEDVLTSSDPAVLEQVRFTSHLPWKRRRQQLLALLPRITDPEILESFRLHLRVPAPPTWRTLEESVEG